MSDEATKIETMVSKKANEFAERYARMDEDFDRWDLKSEGERKSYLDIVRGKPKVRDTDIEVVSNAPRTFSDSVQAILTSSERQIMVKMAEVEGEDKREDIGKLERLLEFAFEKADERLIRLLLPPFKDMVTWYSIVRGWIAGRFLVYKEGKDVIFDFMPLDPRWLVFQTGANGLLWTAYTTPVSPEALESEYGKVVKDSPWYKPWEQAAKSYNVVDYWKNEGKGKVSNSVICNGDFLQQKTYDMLSMPILISPVATRPPVRSVSGTEIKGYGDSILAPNRDIYDLQNRMGTLWASQANLLAHQPMINLKGEDGITLTTTSYLADAVLNLPKGQNELVPAPMKEVSPTLVNFMQFIESRRVAGSLPDIDMGSPPPSGTLYNLVQETSNRVYNPQLRNLNTFYADACRLIEEQLLTSKLKVDVKIDKDKKYYETQVTSKDLGRPHMIKVEFTARTPWTQMDTYQVASMAKEQGLPDEFIWEFILKLTDPKLVKDMVSIEMGENSPKLAILQSIKAMKKFSRGEEAAQLIEDMYLMNKEEENAVNPPVETQTPLITGGTNA